MATEICPYCRQRTAIKVVRKAVSGTLSGVQCEGCNQTYELSLDEGEETTMHKSIERAEKELAETKDKLAKAIEADVEIICATAGLTPDQMRKFAPDVRRQVREKMNAAIARVKATFGDGTSDAGSEMIRQFIETAQGVLALLDCPAYGLTGLTPAELDAIGGDVSKLSSVELVKRIHAAGGHDGPDRLMRKGSQQQEPSAALKLFTDPLHGARRMPDLRG